MVQREMERPPARRGAQAGSGTSGDSHNMYIFIGILALAAAAGVAFATLRLSLGGGRRKKKKSVSKGGGAALAAMSLFCAAILVGGVIMLARELAPYKAGAEAYHAAAGFVTMPGQMGEPAAHEAAEAGEPGAAGLPRVDFAALREKCPDVAAWLTLPDTVIHYPVARADDNEYYLTHLYDGTANKAGCLFIDCGNSAAFTDKNTVIYGHNMRDGSMFAALKEYTSQEYFNAHPRMYLVTPEGGWYVELFAAFTASPGEFGADTSPWALSFQDEAAYAAWLDAMVGRSLVQSGVSPDSSGRALTLSTCTDDGDDRFIVMGRLIAAE